MDKSVVIVAGGSGSRMLSKTPKQFLIVQKKAILMHTLMVFHQWNPHCSLILVLPQDQLSYWDKLCKQYQFTLPHQITTGGATRFHSVQNGLKLVPNGVLVGIHDAVRPLVSKDTIINCYTLAQQKGNAIPYTPLKDSIRIKKDTHNTAVDRIDYVAIHTPQVFCSTQLKAAYDLPYQKEFTDDASVFEACGHRIFLTEGNPDNIKITTPEDLIIFKALYKNRESLT